MFSIYRNFWFINGTQKYLFLETSFASHKTILVKELQDIQFFSCKSIKRICVGRKEFRGLLKQFVY